MSLPLGVLKAVPNTKRKYALEVKTLHVGYVKVGKRVCAAAFTTNELSRPLQRAEKNRKDLPALAPSEDPKIDKLEQENTAMSEELKTLKNRSILQRMKAVFTG